MGLPTCHTFRQRSRETRINWLFQSVLKNTTEISTFKTAYFFLIRPAAKHVRSPVVYDLGKNFDQV